MSNWEKVVEDGLEIWVNEDLGNVYRLPNGEFVAMIPKVISIGKFATPEEAQKTLESPNFKVELSKVLDNFNEEIITKKIVL